VVVLHGLAQYLQGAAAELGQLFEEEEAAMGQSDLAGLGPALPAHQAGEMRASSTAWGQACSEAMSSPTAMGRS